MKRKILNPAAMLAAGLALGVISRLPDIYTQNPGNVFSQTAIWILMGTLATYYATAAVTHGVYHRSFIIGRSVFALCAPVSVGSTVILFDRLRRYDYVIHAALIYFLLFAKVPRGGQKKA